MNTKIILYLLGKICSTVAVIMVLPVLVAFYYGESCYLEFLIAIGVSLYLSFLFDQYAWDADKKDISVREGIGTVFFAWMLTAVLSALPYVFIGLLDPVSAFFESMSGLTTTGATAISDLNIVPKTVLFWRSLTHWVGGIGIIVLFVALLPQIAGGAVYLFNAEVTGFTNNRILPRIRSTAIALFYIYLLMTIILTGILVMLGMSEFDAVNHAFSAVATGGFSTYNESVGYFNNPAIEFIIGVFMIFAAGNFALYYNVTQSGLKVLWHDLEFKVYIGIAATITLLITANIMYVNGFSFAEALRHAFFQTSSFASTTGYVSYNYDEWPSFSKLLLAIMFFTGGCAGSTAGGIKICRFVVLIKTVFAELRRMLHPQMLLTVYYDKKILPIPTIVNISRFFFMYILVVVVLSFALSATGLPVVESIFGVASCISSVGPAFGSIGAVGNYAHVTPFGKIILSMAMLLGRLEIFTVLALLRSEYWRESKRW